MTNQRVRAAAALLLSTLIAAPVFAAENAAEWEAQDRARTE
jgi:hypothetical protein